MMLYADDVTPTRRTLDEVGYNANLGAQLVAVVTAATYTASGTDAVETARNKAECGFSDVTSAGRRMRTLLVYR